MLLTLFVSRTILLAEKASSLDPQVHIMAETTRKMVDDPHAYEMHLPVRGPAEIGWPPFVFLFVKQSASA